MVLASLAWKITSIEELHQVMCQTELLPLTWAHTMFHCLRCLVQKSHVVAWLWLVLVLGWGMNAWGKTPSYILCLRSTSLSLVAHIHMLQAFQMGIYFRVFPQILSTLHLRWCSRSANLWWYFCFSVYTAYLRNEREANLLFEHFYPSRSRVTTWIHLILHLLGGVSTHGRSHGSVAH